MIAKTLTGVPFFDERYGGVYRGRCLLVSGRRGCGRTVLGLQFIHQGIIQGERGLILSSEPSADLILHASALGFSLDRAVESGDLTVLEYHDFIPGRDREETLQLPTEGFMQLQEIIDSNSVKRVVLDTALPWVTLREATHIPEHVFSFVRAFDRLGCTTLLLLPKPISPLAHKLRNALEDVVPISVSLSLDAETDRRIWITNKYLGEKRLDAGVEYGFAQGIGLQDAARVAPTPPPEPAMTPPLATRTHIDAVPVPPMPAAEAGRAGFSGQKIRFSNVVFRKPASSSDAVAAGPARKSFRWGITLNP